jgi:hypothetical protein
MGYSVREVSKMRTLSWLAVVPFVLGFLTGCLEQVDHAGANGLYAFAITEDTPPVTMSDEAALFWVEMRAELPLRPPTDDELADMSAEMPTPFPNRPFHVLGDIGIEVDLVVSNLTDERRVIDITINGFNEFDEYVPSFEIVDDELIVDFSQWERSVWIEPGEQYQVTVTERDLAEIATDLATVVNGAPNGNEVVYFMNQSGSGDPRIDPYIPALIPGLTGMRLGLRAGEASNIVLEASIRLVDYAGKVSDDSENPEEVWVLPVPATYTPMAADYTP